MKTEILKLADIKAAAYNPRKALKPGDEEYERLKNSITEFGFVEPVIVNKRNMTLVGGHQRYTILKDLGETETEAVIVDLDENGEKTLNVALNKIEGDWDIEKLQAVLRDLTEEDVMRTSFGKTEIDDLLKGVREAGAVAEAEAEKTRCNRKSGEPMEEHEPGQAKGFEIYLSFTTQEAAEEWLAAHGVDQAFSDTRSIVLNMEEANESEAG